jgi:glycosyltransferase involved in cell wall biosynthesis
MKPFVTFIIPTIGRPTLRASIESLLAQTDKDWEAIIVGDNITRVRHSAMNEFGYLLGDPRIFFNDNLIKMGHDNVAAQVRNLALPVADGKWIGNLDDDDTLHKQYVEWLKQESENADLVHFRAEWENGIDIRPALDDHTLMPSNMCNAFAFNRQFAIDKGLHYVDATSEDAATIQAFIAAGARVHLSSRVAYMVRH